MNLTRIDNYLEETSVHSYGTYLCALLSVVASACGGDRAVSPVGRSAVAPVHNSAMANGADEASTIRARILNAVAPDDRAGMARLIDSGKSLRVYSNPGLDALLQELTRVRALARVVSKPVSVVTATVAMVDKLPLPNTRAVVIRRANVEPHDVLMIARDGSVADLWASSAALLKLRQRDGDTPVRDAVAAVPAVGTRRTWNDVRDQAAQRMLADLQNARPTNVRGVGEVRNTTIGYLPVGK